MLIEKIINCSGCGQLLKLPNKNQVAVRQLQCPKCGKLLVVSFLEEDKHKDAAEEDGTVCDPSADPSNPCPYIEFEGNRYYLTRPVNVIGRRATTSSADIQLPTRDMYMGRHHAVIARKTDETGNNVCTLKAKDAKNGLSVSNINVGPDDEIKLLDGAIIKMGKSYIIYRTQ